MLVTFMILVCLVGVALAQPTGLLVSVWGTGLYFDTDDSADCFSGHDPRWRVRVRVSEAWVYWNEAREDLASSGYIDAGPQNLILDATTPLNQDLFLELDAYEDDIFLCGSDDGVCGGYGGLQTIEMATLPECTNHEVEITRLCGLGINSMYEYKAIVTYRYEYLFGNVSDGLRCPTNGPTRAPTLAPTRAPTTKAPTGAPTETPKTALLVTVWGTDLYFDTEDSADCYSGHDPRWRVRVRVSDDWVYWNEEYEDIPFSGYTGIGSSANLIFNATTLLNQSLFLGLDAYEDDDFLCGSDDGICGGYGESVTREIASLPACMDHQVEVVRRCGGTATGEREYEYRASVSYRYEYLGVKCPVTDSPTIMSMTPTPSLVSPISSAPKFEATSIFTTLIGVLVSLTAFIR